MALVANQLALKEFLLHQFVSPQYWLVIRKLEASMFSAFFFFELRYWLRAMMVYVFLTIIGLVAFAVVSSDNVQVGGSLENANRNSPYTIQMMYAAFSIISVVMTAELANGAAHDSVGEQSELLSSRILRTEEEEQGAKEGCDGRCGSHKRMLVDGPSRSPGDSNRAKSILKAV